MYIVYCNIHLCIASVIKKEVSGFDLRVGTVGQRVLELTFSIRASEKGQKKGLLIVRKLQKCLGGEISPNIFGRFTSKIGEDFHPF